MRGPSFSNLREAVTRTCSEEGGRGGREAGRGGVEIGEGKDQKEDFSIYMFFGFVELKEEGRKSVTSSCWRKKGTYRVPPLLDLDDLEPLLLSFDVLVDGAHHARHQLDRCLQVL